MTANAVLMESAKGADARHQTIEAHRPFGGRCARYDKELTRSRGGALIAATVLREFPKTSEWTPACEIHQRLMAQSRPVVASLDHSAYSRQLHSVGGDFYEFVPLSGDRFAIAVGDASGKGLPAALMASNVQSSLRTASVFAGHQGSAALEEVNRQVFESSLANRYATLFYAVLDNGARTLRYVNAGHNPPMVIRRDNSIDWLEIGGAPIGMFPDWKYEEGAVDLHPGDLVLAYTDGIIEATNPAGEEWGIEGLQKAAAECDAPTPDDIVRAIFSAMDQFTHGSQTDDATVVALRVH
jgi:sigma-B regulation protein RsbU (phosphoserine phosphatase)